MSGQIFINYRREDGRWSARSLYDRLVARFGRKQIFMDVDSLKPGVDFFEAIEKSVGSCDVLIAIIGTHCFLVAMTKVSGGLIIRRISSGWRSLRHSGGKFG